MHEASFEQIFIYLLITAIGLYTYVSIKNYFTRKRRKDFLDKVEANAVDDITSSCPMFLKSIKIPDWPTTSEVIVDMVYNNINSNSYKDVIVSALKKIESDKLLLIGNALIKNQHVTIFQLMMNYSLDHNVILLFQVKIKQRIIDIYTEESDFDLETKNIWLEFISKIKTEVFGKF